MTFTIRYLRDGRPVGNLDRASTMFDARKTARLARDSNTFHAAVILAPAASGVEKEIEVIRFQ